MGRMERTEEVQRMESKEEADMKTYYFIDTQAHRHIDKRTQRTNSGKKKAK